MKQINLKVKEVEEFVKSHVVLYATNCGKKFFILLHAGPNVERYVVVDEEGRRDGFKRVGDAVRRFNEW
jgi:hypothetical protein